MAEGLALGIRYLTGYAVATDPANRDEAEWPPHPGRVFMALAAAHFETGEDPDERGALEWLEGLDRPRLHASDAQPRSTVTHFVPVNDEAGPSSASLQSAPGFTRHRVGRPFPRVRPDDDTVYLIWPDAAPTPAHRHALQRLCSKVVRIGHSSSLVQVWCLDSAEDLRPNLEPADSDVAAELRVVTRGTLAYLQRQANVAAVHDFARLGAAITGSRGAAQRQAKAAFRERFGRDWRTSLSAPRSQRPVLGVWQGYRRTAATPDREPLRTVFDPALLVLRLERRLSSYERLDVITTLRVTDVFRKAIRQVADRELGIQTLPEVLTGHQSDGSPTDRPHVAFFPLAFVGRAHASGHLMGLAIAMPRNEHWNDHHHERRTVMAVISRVVELTLGHLGTWKLEPVLRETPGDNLLPSTWTATGKGARVWASVTPVAFDKHPKQTDRAGYQAEAEALVARMCPQIGLPEPRNVRVSPVSAHLGTPASRDFPRLARKDGSERRHTHVVLEFERPVVGPVALGAGRYRGYGFCRPVQGD